VLFYFIQGGGGVALDDLGVVGFTPVERIEYRG